MSFYTLRVNFSQTIGSRKNVCIGKVLGFLGTDRGRLLLYSSGYLAEHAARSSGIENIEIFPLDTPAGFSINEIVFIDHFSAAVLDDTLPVIFFSCASGRYLLPSHFYLKDQEGFKALEKDDQWRRRDIDLENPSCACGGMLTPFVPFELKLKKKQVIPGLTQVVAGNHTTHDSPRCVTAGFIDLIPPDQPYCLEVLLGGKAGQISFSYLIAQEGFNYLESEFDFFQIYPWDIHPLSNLARIRLPEITSDNGVEWCELFLAEKNTSDDYDTDDFIDSFMPRSLLRRLGGTGKAKNIPTIQYEAVPKLLRDHIAKSVN